MDCENCTKQEQDYNGCVEDSKEMVWRNGKDSYRRCPLKLVQSETWQMIELYNFFKEGHLNADGGLENQTVKYKQIIFECEKAYAERREDGKFE